MKKVLCLLMVLAMAVGCISINVSAAEYGIVLNNNVALMVGSTTAIARNSLQTLSAAPAVVDGEVFVPLSAVTDLFNGVLNYNADTGIIDIRFGAEKHAVLRVGSKQYTLGGRGYDYAVAPQEVNGTVMVPLMLIAKDIIGQTVFYDASTQLIVVSSRRVLKDSVTDAAVISTIANAIRTRILPEITVPTEYEIDWTVVSSSGSQASNNQGQLPFVSVVASDEPEPQNGANNVMDGSVGTVWAIGTYGGQIVGDIGYLNNITEIKVAFARYSERSANYELWVSEDNKTFTKVFSGASTQGQQWSTHSVNGAYRYVKLVSNGNSNGSEWNSIAEIQVFNGSSGSSSTTTETVVGTPISSSTFTYRASAEPEVENNASMAFDGNTSTRWAAEGENHMDIDLGSSKKVVAVSVQMISYEDGRSVNYSVSYSNDGASYTDVYNGAAQPGGGVEEIHEIGQDIRYIRIGVNGSTTNNWASIAEIVVYGEYVASATAGSSSGGSTVSVGDEIPSSSYSYTATAEPESQNPARNAFDGNANTFWAAEGSQSITIDLGTAQEVSAVGVQMRSYSDNPNRSVNYSVEYSADGSSYTSAFNGAAAAGGGVLETRSVGAAARYIRVGVNGSNEGSWASLAEIKVYGAAAAVAPTGYQNMDSVSGQFMLAVEGTTDVLYVKSDGYYLGVGSNDQKWALEGAAVRNTTTNTYLDVAEESYDEGATIGVWEGNGGANQQWTFEKDDNGYYIKSSMSGLYLSSVGGNIQQVSKARATKWVVTDGTMAQASAAGTSSGTAVVGAPDIESLGEFVLSAENGTGVLSVNDDQYTLSVEAYSGADAQKWSLNGSTIVNSATEQTLGVDGGSLGLGIRLCVDSVGNASHRWTFERDGSGYYIKNNNSGLYITYVDNVVQQRARANATRWIPTATGNAVATAPSEKFTNLDSVSGNFVLVPQNTENALTVTADDYTLAADVYTGDARQLWTIDGSGIKNVGTGTYLDVAEESYDVGATIGVWEGNGGLNQQWSLEKDGNGYYVKSTMSGLYLSLSGANVQQVSKANATKWVVANGANTVNTPGVAQVIEVASKYTNLTSISGNFIIAQQGSDLVLTVGDDNYTLALTEYASDAKQQWALEGASFKSIGAGAYMDVNGQSTEEGAQIGVWEFNGGDNQIWTFEREGNGYYIRSVLSNLYLSVVDGNVQQVSRNNACKWIIANV